MNNNKPISLLRAACGLAALLFVSDSFAAPWLAPGDLRARHAVQKLADSGYLQRSASTWPMMWADIDTAKLQLSSRLAAPASYLSFERNQQTRPFRAELELSGSSQTDFSSSFSNRRYEEGAVNLIGQWQSDALAVGVAASHVSNASDSEDWRYDGSYIAATAGNWVLGAGAIDRWWGPGWQSSLILSNNARPVPAVWLSRKQALAPESPWLQWLGPWQLTTFAGQLEKPRVVSEPVLLGMRFTFRPLAGLDIGLSRVIMVGGEGRPDDLSAFRDAILGIENGQQGEGFDPGNQLAAIDLRYGFTLADKTLGLYVQQMGEDEAGGMPAKKSWLLGVDWTSNFAAADQQWYLEYANTLTDSLFGDVVPNVSYQHGIYASGYRYYGRSMGASIDSDAEALSLGFWHFMRNGHNLGVNLSRLHLNQRGDVGVVVSDGAIAYQEPLTAQDINEASVQYQLPLLGGWVNIEARLADDKLFLLAGEHKHWSLEAGWRYRF